MLPTKTLVKTRGQFDNPVYTSRGETTRQRDNSREKGLGDGSTEGDEGQAEKFCHPWLELVPDYRTICYLWTTRDEGLAECPLPAA